jgi:hypothetical protein
VSPIENAIVEKLQKGGPCCLDDVVTYLPNSSWGEVFVAVDRMSRDGRLSVHQFGYSTYQIALHSQFLCNPVQPLARRGGRDDNESSGGLTREVERASGSLTLCPSEPDIERAVPEMERD